MSLAAPTPRAWLEDPETYLWAQMLAGDRFPVSVSATYSAQATDRFILVDSTAGAVTVNLPDAATVKGLLLYIKRVAGGNNVTIDGSGSQTIDGATTVTLAAVNEWCVIQSDGANWQIWAQSSPSTFTNLTVTNLTVTNLTIGGVALVIRSATQNISLATGTNNNVTVNDDTGILQVSGTGASASLTITGFTGGAADRRLLVWAVDGTSMTQLQLSNENASSTAANRLKTIATLVVPLRRGAWLFYNVTDSRWNVL